MWPEETLQRHACTLKDSLNVNIPPEFWKQIAPDRAKWRCLNRKGADDYEATRVNVAERKRKKRKTRAKGSSSSELSFSGLTCSICNRQFRATTGLISHQRTQHEHLNNSKIKMVLLTPER